MPEKDVLFSISLPDGTKTTLNQEQYSQAQDKLFAKFPDAQVSRVQSYIADDEDANDTDSYHVQLPDGTSTVLDSSQFASNRQKLREKFPDAQIARVSDMTDRYWRPKLEEAQAALDSFNQEHGKSLSQYESYKMLAENSEKGEIPNFNSPSHQWLREHEAEYLPLKEQRDSLRKAIYGNPIVTRGRQQAHDNAMTLRERYLALAEQAETGAERRDYKRAAKLQGDAAELYAAPGEYDTVEGKNGFQKYLDDYKAGTVNTFSDRDFWYRGLPQIARDLDLHGIRKKVQQEEKRKGGALDERDFDRILTPSEKAELMSFYNLARAQSDEVIGRANDLSSAYRAGQGAAESLGFMAEFLLSQGLANVAGKALSGTSNAFAQWMGRALMSDKALARAVKNGVTTIPQMSKAAKVGTELARPIVQGLWHTGTQLSTLSNIATMMNQTNDEGELNSVGKGIWLGLADSFVENWSESLGNTMDKGFDLGLEKLGNLGEKALGKTTFGRMARWALNTPFHQTLKEAGFNGFFGEMLEEWAGNAVRLATGLMDKDEFKQFASVEQQLEMAASFAPMSLFGLGGNIISTTRHNKEYKRLAEKSKSILMRNGVDQAAIDELFGTRFDTGEDVAKKLAPYAQKVLNSGSETAKEDYLTLLRLAEESGIQAFNEAVQEEKNQERRNEVQEAISAKAGQFWQDFDSPEAKETDGSPVQIHQVRVVQYADGAQKYIVRGENYGNGNRLYATVDKDGNNGYITDSEIAFGLEEGTITSDRELLLQEYLQEQVDAIDKSQEAARMEKDVRDQVAAVRAHIKQQPVFNMGTPEQPVLASVVPGTETAAGATVVIGESGVQSSMTWKEIAAYLGTPLEAKTDEQLNEEAAAAQQAAIERKEKYNTIPVGAHITVTLPGAEGDEQVPYRFAKAIYDDSENTVRIYVADENGNILTDSNGEEVWFPEEMVVDLDSAAEQAQQPAAAEEVEQGPVEETKAPAVQKYTKEDGKVNQTAFFKNEPEEWAKWNDEKRQDGGANSKERLAASLGELNKEIEDLTKKKAATANPDDAEALEERVNTLVARQSQLKAIYDAYIAREQAVKAAEDEAKRAEFEADLAKKKAAEKKEAAKIQDDLKEDASFVELAQNYAEQPKTYGDTDTYNVGGRKFKGRWVVAEATTPKPSHNPLDDFAPTPGYPIGKAGNSNHYDKDKRAQEITREMSNPFDERAVQEPVVVTKHGIVLSGNGRTQARLLAAQQQTDADYKEYIREHASKWGLTAEEIEQYENPMLYFELEEDVEYTAALFDAFNRSTSKQQSVTETAAKVAQMTSDELVMRLDRLFREIGDNIDNLYKNPEKVNELLNMLQAAGIFNANERARFVDEYGNLSGAGEDLVESVLFGTIFSSSDESVRAAMNDKAIRRAVAFAFPTLVRLRNLNGEFSLAQELGEAVSLVAAAKAANGGKAENAIIDYMLQGDLFTGETPVVKATVQLLAHVLNDGKYGSLRSVLNQYIERAELANYGQANMFEGDVESKEQILRDVLAHNKINIETYGNQTESAGQSGVPANDEVRPAPGEQGSSQSGADAEGTADTEGVQGEGAPAAEGEQVDLLKVAKEQAAKNRLLKKLQKRISKWEKFLGKGAFEIANGIEDIEKIEDEATRQQVLERQQQHGDVEGWFANGKAVIYLPNIPDTRTLDRKIMHEVIAHKGIKGLFEAKGEGEFNKFLDWTWGNLMNDAARSYYLNYPGVAELKTLQQRQRAAADEFLAHCAEKETAVIAQVDEDFWSRLVEALRNFINDAMGEDVFKHEDDSWFASLLNDAAKSVREGAAPTQQEEENTLFSVSGTKKALASAVPGDESPFKATVVTSADGAKILNNLEQFADDAKNLSFRGKNSFVKTLGSKLGAKQEGSNSLYATFEAKNGTVFTIRLADHNAKVSNFDNRDEDNGVSIVISRQPNSGITNDGTAQVEEFFYSDKSLRNSDDNAYEKIVRAVIQSLYSGSYKDTTGLATYEKVNGEEVTTNAIPNEMTEGNVLFSVDGSLVGIHNISGRKLASAIRTGGLANPSMAVIDMYFQVHEDYGDISLVAPASLIDSETGRNAGTYNGDAWTPTYPGVSKQMSDKGWDKFFDRVRVLPEPFSHQVRNDWREYLDDDRMGRSLKWWFLQDTGRNPETVYNTSNLSEEDKELVRSFSGKKIFGTDEDASKAIEMFRRLADPEEVERAGRKIEIKEGRSGRYRDWAIARNEDIDSWGIFTAPVVGFIEELQRQVRYEGTIAEQSTYQSAEDFVRDNNLDGEFQQWLQDKEKEFGVKEVLFAGWTPDGDRKYVPNTVENASRLMNKEPDQNAYGNGGLSATRSLLLERMDTLEEIRKNRGQLADIRGYASETPEYEAASSNWFNVIEALANMQKISDNQFSNIDYAEARLQEAIQERNPIAYLNKEYRYHIPEDGEFAEALKASLKEIKNLPAKYFETKFRRPVYLNEFAAAVIPTDTAEGVRKELEKAGLPIFEYNEKEEGSREQAVRLASEIDGVRFSVGDYQSGEAQEQYRQQLENTPEFKEWFKGSKVVDENGNPLVVYRGATFDPLTMADGLGVIKPQAYFSPSEEYARRYGPWTRSYYLNIQNPFDIRNKKDLEIYKKMLPDGYVIAKTGSGAADWAEFGAAVDIDTLMDNHPEYDGIILDEGGDPDGNGGVTSRGVSYIPLRGGAQVKSAEVNNGQFSPENPDVRFAIATPEEDAAYMQAIEAGDMETAERMVREAAAKAMPDTEIVSGDGLPGIVYHGTALRKYDADYLEDIDEQPFTVFSTDRQMGAHFGTKKQAQNRAADKAEKDGGYVDEEYIYRVFLNIKKALVVSDVYTFGRDDLIADLIKRGEMTKDESLYVSNERELKEFIESKGYDGLAYSNKWEGSGWSFVAFHPEQIKSAEPVTYDENGNIVPLSERFNPNNNDIRFSVSGYKNFSEAQDENKVPGKVYPDVDDSEVRFSLSKNNKATVEAWLRKRQDLTDEQRQEVFNYIDNLETPTLQLATAKWFCQGAIRLPEDMDKVEQAVSVAGKAKVDPLQYSSPMELLDEHANFKASEKRINPDTVPTLHKSAEYPEQGLVVYDVDESDESRENMRKIINTHFGEDASPWCLLQGDGGGNLTAYSKQYWQHYNAYPKQVAFKDGKLLAFSANDHKQKVWWDRQDAPHGGIPIEAKLPNDELKRSATMEFNTETKELGNPTNIHRGNKQNGTYELWSDEGTLIVRYNYKDGKPNGKCERWHRTTGKPWITEEMKNGRNVGDYYEWWDDGAPKIEAHFDQDGFKNGELKSWHENGRLGLLENYVDGMHEGVSTRWNSKGQITTRVEYKNGRTNGLYERWDNGQLAQKTTYKDGEPEGKSEEWWQNGNKRKETFYKDGIEVGPKKQWAESGNLVRTVTFNEKGERDGEQVEYYDFDGGPDGNGARNPIEHVLHWKDGRQDGEEVFYREDGKIARRCNWENGKVQGLYEQWHPNGFLQVRAEYKNGRRDGVVEMYSAMDGRLIGRALWEDDEIVENLPLHDEGETEVSGTLFSIVTDENELERLDSQPTITLYRAMELVDGQLYPPMSQKVPNAKSEKGKKLQRREGVVPGMWQKSDEDPSKAYQKEEGGPWYYDLKKVKGSDVNGVLYNPYLHLSVSPLNDQFTSASTRPDLVVVACEVPISELSSGYKAEKANDTVGAKDWHSGTVTAQLGEGRQVVLSRWAKIGRIVPDAEVAAMVDQKLLEKDIVVPANVVTPSLRAALEQRGVKFSDGENEADTRFSINNRIFRAEERRPGESAKAYGMRIAYTYDNVYHKGAVGWEPRNGEGERGDMAYSRDTKKIVIFVKNKMPSVFEMEMLCFHESLHAWIDKLSEEDKKTLLDTYGVAPFAPEESRANARDLIRGMEYEEEQVPEEYLTYTFSEAMSFGKVPSVLRAISDEGRTILDNILKSIDYDVEQETKRRVHAGADRVREADADELGERAGVRNALAQQGERGEEDSARFSVANRNQEIFVSNAERAANSIKMEKATPAQWLAMLEKSGGLKAGEDKWLGLSDWLKASDKKTITKQEILDFIDQNKIQIEETTYVNDLDTEKVFIEDVTDRIVHGKSLEELQAEVDELAESPQRYDAIGDDNSELDSYLMRAMKDEYGDDFELGFYIDEGKLNYNYDPYSFDREDFNEQFAGYQKMPEPTRLSYTTDGLTNKREIALTVPTIEPWNEEDKIHFGDAGEGRAIAWARFGDARYSEGHDEVDGDKDAADEFYRKMQGKYHLAGNALLIRMTDEEIRTYSDLRSEKHDAEEGVKSKVLFIDEIQSKRHQTAREKDELGNEIGYKDKELEEKANRHNELSRKSYSDEGLTFEEHKEFRQLQEELYNVGSYNIERNRKAVPAAPFEKNWHELAMKRMLRLAAEEGYDYVAWTTGAQQAERYNLNKMVSEIAAMADGNGNYYVVIEDKQGFELSEFSGSGKKMTANEMVSYFGKDLAIRLMTGADQSRGKEWSGKGYNPEFFTVRGDDLQVGGEGMKGFYDDILVRFVNKYAKKWDASVKDDLVMLEDGALLEAHILPITQEMKDSVMEGQVMFSVRAAEDARRDGIGAVIGPENVSEFYMELYRALPSAIRAEVTDMALASLNFTEATQEYISNLAARGNDGTGTLRMAKQTLAEYAGEQLTDGAARYILWRGTNGVNENDLLDVAHDQFLWNYLKVDNPEDPNGPDDGPGKGTIERAREETDTNPTEAQKEAGNYKHGHVSIDGYNISLENPKGTVRSGKDDKGNEWSVTMNNDYGYIRMTEGLDGDQIDVFLSDNPERGNVYVVDQVNRSTGEFDEHKVMYGFNTIDDAREAYLANYSEGWKGLGAINGVTKDEFKKWIESSTRKTKPFADYKSVRFSVGESVGDAEKAADAAIDEAQERLKQDKKDLKDVLTAAKAMAAQKTYDKSTVETVTNLAKRILKDQYIDALSRREVARLLGIVRTSVGKAPKTVKKNADAIVEMVIDNLLKREKQGLEALTKTTGTKTNATGVEVQGELDVQGQKTLKAFKDGLKQEIGDPSDDETMSTLYGLRARLADRLSSKDDATRKDAEAEDAGLALAIEYKEKVKSLLDEEKDLQDELKDLAADLKDGNISKSDYAESVRATEDAIRENRIDQVEAFRDFRHKMQQMLSGSAEARRSFVEREKARVEAIHHLANSDMQGRSADTEKKPTFADKLANSPLVQFFAAPLKTFDQMLRLFGDKNIAGEGYLWSKYMRGWQEASENAYIGQRDAKKRLDEKASEVFGEDMKWADLFDKERNMPTATIKWRGADGEMKEHELTQGQMLYIYMVNKMADGRMKLRKMGIDEDDVQEIKRNLDERFVKLADWLQEEFLVDLRNKYNAVHERLFGASMAAIDNYFPLVINKRDLNRNEDIAALDYESLPSTTTGSIIKRRRNSKALDLLNADAFSVILNHIDQMEQWAAFAEFNKDINALLSYKRFRNQVQNMASVYGSGNELWKNFKDVSRIAGNAYHPDIKRSSLDTAAVNLAKGVTSAKISFRAYTALKQFLSMPAFLADANVAQLAADMANPVGAWNWAMENLPLFEKRWKSRIAGDTRLMTTDMDWKVFRSKVYDKLSKLGMTPNAFVDAWTVAVGAHAIYKTKYNRYIKEGFSEEQADKKAKQDATVLYNETQQSNENAFLSPVQLDRTLFATAITVFRNSSMGFQRQLHDAVRNLGKMLRPGYKEQSIEFMTKQLEREGLSAEQAKDAAEKRYEKALMRNSIRVATFGFLVQFAWNLGGSLAYLLFGDDDDEKEEMLREAFVHGLIGGPIEGLAGGNVMSDALNMIAKGESLRKYDPTLLPVLSDMKRIYSMMGYDKVAAWNEVFNLATQALVGVNPQTFEDMVVAVIDACNGDPQTSKEAMLLIMRVLQVPQSQVDKIYIDELGMSAANAKRLSPQQMAKRYANYKLMRNAAEWTPAYSDELKAKRLNTYEKQFKNKVKERKELKNKK